MKLLTWDNITSLDDVILDCERKIIQEVTENTNRKCPYLKKTGSFFYYCGMDFPDGVNINELSPNNPVYRRKVDLILLQMHCMKDYETCCTFSGKLPWKN